MYTRIPPDTESKTPSTIRAVGLFSTYVEEIPIPIAIPVGVVSAKQHAIVVADR
jgi:hypothetical protein